VEVVKAAMRDIKVEYYTGPMMCLLSRSYGESIEKAALSQIDVEPCEQQQQRTPSSKSMNVLSHLHGTRLY